VTSTNVVQGQTCTIAMITPQVFES